jgi:membrane protein YqaA with SNARE-associated domain
MFRGRPRRVRARVVEYLAGQRCAFRPVIRYSWGFGHGVIGMDLATNLAHLTGAWGLYLGTFVYCVVSGLIPVVNCEAYLIVLGATAPRGDLPVLLLLACVGQMAAKYVLYQTGRGVLRLPFRRYQAKVEALQERMARGRWTTDGIVFMSAVTGIPPLYPLSIAAGTLAWPLRRFLVYGFCGRVIRFGVVLALPAVVTPHLERNVVMNLLLALAIGLLAGAHTSTWGMYKDCPYEGFTYRKYARSILVSACVAVVWAMVSGLDLSVASGRLVLFGLTYVTERGLVELYKGYIREEDQSKYFIPMQLHVMGKVVKSRAVRWSVAGVWVLAIAGIAWWLRSWQQAPGDLAGWKVVLIIGSIGGWLSAFGGAFKDAPIEGFETFKFFRSPALALFWSFLIAGFSTDYLFIALCGLGFTVATIETYKTFFFPNKPRGKFAGKPIQHPQLLQWRYRFVPLYAAIWVLVISQIAAAFYEPAHGLVALPFAGTGWTASVGTGE